MVKIIAGNWKMHGNTAMAHALALAVADGMAKCPSGTQVVLCPPAVLLAPVATSLVGSEVRLGGQDCHAEAEGAYTGDISAAMLKDAGCSYVIVGHSERRQGHGETDAAVRAKVARAIASDLIPIICIGETAAEREGGDAESVVERQIRGSIPETAGNAEFVLAYEPVWAIGSGKTPTVNDIARMHAHILAVAAAHTGLTLSRIPVLYGGSVKAANAAEIMAIPGVSGVLVGGASLKAEEFRHIIAAA